MVILTNTGVRYTDRRGRLVDAYEGSQIPQEEYDAMKGWERYAVLSHFASQGDTAYRFDSI